MPEIKSGLDGVLRFRDADAPANSSFLEIGFMTGFNWDVKENIKKIHNRGQFSHYKKGRVEVNASCNSLYIDGASGFVLAHDDRVHVLKEAPASWSSHDTSGTADVFKATLGTTGTIVAPVNTGYTTNWETCYKPDGSIMTRDTSIANIKAAAGKYFLDLVNKTFYISVAKGTTPAGGSNSYKFSYEALPSTSVKNLILQFTEEEFGSVVETYTFNDVAVDSLKFDQPEEDVSTLSVEFMCGTEPVRS